MVLTGIWLYPILILLTLWFVFLSRLSWKLLRAPRLETGPYETLRSQLTIAGMGLAAVAVGALLLLNLTWTSVDISQYLGSTAIKILSLLLFFPSVLGFLFSCLGSGRIRFLGVGTSFLTGCFWFGLVMGAAISMSASITRHPTRFLIPDGYVGWVEVKYGDSNVPALQMDKGTLICRIPDNGLLATSSAVEEGWAKDEYFYYSKDGSLRDLKETGWGAGGMIWGNTNEWQQSQTESKLRRIDTYIYIGTEQQYHRAVAINEIRPFDESKNDKVVH
jgi:hypothetical protein